MNPTAAYWGRVLLANAAAAVVVVAVEGGFAPGVRWHETFVLLGIGMVYGNAIGTLLGIGVPWAARRHCSGSARRDWAVIVAAIVLLTIVGTTLGELALVAIGVVRPIAFWRVFAGSLEIAMTIALVIGVAVSAYEILRQRLQSAELALRTKERDEADVRRIAAEAQLAALESRIHPHFLFNTLNSIAALIPDDPRAAERMTVRLSSLLRSTLDERPGASPLVSLGDELETVRDYLEIERIRFGERLRYRIDLARRLEPSRVPRLALQTLVENAVKHAVSVRREGAAIVVAADERAGRLQLTVEDDGPGFDGSRLPESHGLDLLRTRLAMIFGDQASLRIAAVPGSTRITIDLPAYAVRQKPRLPFFQPFFHPPSHAARIHRR